MQYTVCLGLYFCAPAYYVYCVAFRAKSNEVEFSQEWGGLRSKFEGKSITLLIKDIIKVIIKFINKKRKGGKLSTVLLTVREAARRLSVHPNTLRRWSNKGIIGAHRIGPRRDRRFREEDIEIFLNGSG